MYYVNRQQIDIQLQVVPMLELAITELREQWSGTSLQHLAQERILHLAIEMVTDVGSLLIDGFILRDASSYEDIIDIIVEAEAVDVSLHGSLAQLVQLRKPLVQHYVTWERAQLHEVMQTLDHTLNSFKQSVESYLVRELD